MSELPPSPATTFGTTSYREVVSCRVCGRTLLMGERSTGFFTATGDGPYDVCDLCVPRAGRFGLRARQSTSGEVARTRGARRTFRLGRMRLPRLRPLLESVSPARARAVVAPPRPTGLLAAAAAPVGSAAIPGALATFNASPHARTLAGLYRTLGEPRASVTPRSATDREVIVTVAWEIVWYQFRIMLDGIEVQQGTYLSDLPQRWQQWNCDVTPGGAVHETGAPGDETGHEPMMHSPELEGFLP